MDMTQEQLNEIVRLHGLWLSSRGGGARANLIGADLSGADLSGADLSQLHGVRFADCAWSGHGECGRRLSGAVIGGDIRLFCGCFAGSVSDLEEYIADGDERHRESRTIAMRFVAGALFFGGVE